MSASDEDFLDTPNLGKENGLEVEMMVHHSKNTKQKLWVESLILLLSNLGKFFRTHMLVLVGLEEFSALFEKLLKVCTTLFYLKQLKLKW